MLEWLAVVKESEMDVMLMTPYQVWLARNDVWENRNIEDPEAVAKRAIHLIEE
jgi:hypothetical protein